MRGLTGLRERLKKLEQLRAKRHGDELTVELERCVAALPIPVLFALVVESEENDARWDALAEELASDTTDPKAIMRRFFERLIATFRDDA